MTRSRTSDEGFTLVEVLVTLVLVGIGVSGVLAALMTGVRGSKATAGMADARALLNAAAEQVQAAPYAPCAGTGGYASALTSASKASNSDGSNVASQTLSVSIAYWSVSSAGVPGFSTSDCSYDSSGASGRLQRITLTSQTDEQLTIVKRAP